MKLNNKGLTLAELIVSFMLVSVAIVYFFQTLITVNKLYQTAREETNEFIEKDYYLRLVEAYFDGENVNENNDSNDQNFASAALSGLRYRKEWNGNILILKIRKNGNTKDYAILYKYIDSNLKVDSGGK